MNLNIKYLIESFIDDEDEIVNVDIEINRKTILQHHIEDVLNGKTRLSKKLIISEYNMGHKYIVKSKEEILTIIKRIKMDLYNWLNTSQITDMSELFYRAENFNKDISGWDVSNVTSMAGMFLDATSFNLDIGNWDVSNVTSMEGMFYGAESFNLDISRWDVSNVTDMFCMFLDASSFNLPIGNWDVSNVTDMQSMFNKAESFNLDISNWDVSNVIYKVRMFDNCTSLKKFPIWYHE